MFTLKLFKQILEYNFLCQYCLLKYYSYPTVQQGKFQYIRGAPTVHLHIFIPNPDSCTLFP